MEKRKVIKADVLGFCMGVRAAMNKLERAVERRADGERVMTYGPLIHNQQVLDALSAKGVGRIDSPEEVQEGTVVIRAHGVKKNTIERLRARGTEVVDGTCPRVLRSMRTVERYGQEGYQIVLYGDASHGEIKALEGYAEKVVVVENPEQARNLELEEKALVLAQTTVSIRGYEEVCRILQEKNPHVVIMKSICPATRDRQEALKRLIEQVEALLVVGGRHSSNTKRLYELARDSGKTVAHIETAREIPAEFARFSVVGITAGASTPDWIIDEVESAVRKL